MELSMPLGVSATLGVALPARNSRVMDFVTSAPSWLRSITAASSGEKVPDAGMTGLASATSPT